MPVNNNNYINYNTGMEIHSNEIHNSTPNYSNLDNVTLYQRILTDIYYLLFFSFTKKDINNYFNGKNYKTLSPKGDVSFNQRMRSFYDKFHMNFNKGGYSTNEKNAFRILLREVERYEKQIQPNTPNDEYKYDALINVFDAIQTFVNTLRPGSNIRGSFFIKDIDKKMTLLKKMKHNQTLAGMTNVGPRVSNTNIPNITSDKSNYFNRKNRNYACKNMLTNKRNNLIIRIFKTCPRLLHTSIPLTCKDIRLIRDYVKSQCKHT